MGNKIAKLILICLMSCMDLLGQQVTLNELAALVAGKDTRQQAVSFVSYSRRERIPLLIELTTASFPDVDAHDLRVGLADIFGELKVQESVPFLVGHLTLRRNERIDFAPWMKKENVVLESFPCIQTLVSIGASASRALIKEYAGSTDSEGRLAAIFVVAHIPGVPEAIGFLKSVSNPTVLERYYIDKGLALQTN